MGRQDHSSRQGRSRKKCILEVDDDEDVVNLVTTTPVKRLVIASSKPLLLIQEGTSSTTLSTMTMSPMQLTNMGKLQEEVMVPTISAMLVLCQSQPVVPLDVVGFDDHHGLSVVRQKLQRSKACDYEMGKREWSWVPLPEFRTKGLNMAGIALSSGLTL
ncbi:hypothetical protein GIB67_043287 [Kingdonia uniflora]|uniref:Uncharacterized protein n=1 Tax=Kingdonia uniflora TaxID=39325 RepID=A0A7J7M282_9MAGN|nr:hypothetical protein GIB67_043287 [Kingdonia uniflora]